MKATRWILPVLAFCLAAVLAPAQGAKQEVKSPDGNLVLTFNLTADGAPVYDIAYKGKPVILESRLGLEIKDGAGFVKGLKVTGAEPGNHDETWTPVAAERSPIRDHYNTLAINLEGAQGKLQLAIRAYDEGVGFRYTLPEQAGLKAFTITNELTEYRFDGDYPCWPVYAAQAQYSGGKKLSDVRKDCERPLTVEIPGGPAVAIGEAGMVDYFRMRLQPSDRPNAVTVYPNGVVNATAPFSSPWRFVMVADTPGKLIEHDYLVLNFNEPSKIQDTSWIKPGKVIREGSLTTTGGKACIDFAAQMGLKYIEFDAGWYGPENEMSSDASRVLPGRALDFKEVVEYGDSKGIGVILYINHKAMEQQASVVFPLYHKWGIKGVKFGFVNVGPQQWTKWVADNIKLCAENQLMVDIHDEYRPTGLSRTWPNLMTMEGVGGDEEFPPAEHMASLPFTRELCGPFDNTICMFNGRLLAPPGERPNMMQGQRPRQGNRPNQAMRRSRRPQRIDNVDRRKSRAFQLAKAVVVFSPWQFLYWYDNPAMYHGEPYLDFWKTIPTVWDETRVINGVIGQYITDARRSGQEWYVGSVNALQRRTLDIPLSFLEPGKKYTAEIYNEGVPGSRAAEDLIKINIEKKTVDSTTVIKADMSDIGGHAMRLVPAN